MHISISKPGKIYNEDRSYSGEQYSWVIDGATGLTSSKITDSESDAIWFVSEWENYLHKNILNTSKSLETIIYEGIHAIRLKFLTTFNIDYLTPISRPSASIAITRINNGMLEYLSLGDCTLLIKTTTNSIQTIKSDSLDNLDNKAITKMHNYRLSTNCSFLESREHINDVLIHHRSLKNTEEGYWSLEFEARAASNALTGSIPLETIQETLIMSDGFSCYYDKYSLCPKDNIFELIQTTSLTDIYDKIRTVELSDSECLIYPRFKIHDDSSAAYNTY